MRGATLSLAVWCLLTFDCDAQAGQTDGNVWRTFDRASKGAYVKGFRDAMAACRAFATPKVNSGSLTANEECTVLMGTDDNKIVALILKVTPSPFATLSTSFIKTRPTGSLPRALGVIFILVTGASAQRAEGDARIRAFNGGWRGTQVIFCNVCQRQGSARRV